VFIHTLYFRPPEPVGNRKQRAWHPTAGFYRQESTSTWAHKGPGVEGPAIAASGKPLLVPLLQPKPAKSTRKHTEHRGSAETQNPQFNSESGFKSLCATDNSMAAFDDGAPIQTCISHIIESHGKYCRHHHSSLWHPMVEHTHCLPLVIWVTSAVGRACHRFVDRRLPTKTCSA